MGVYLSTGHQRETTPSFCLMSSDRKTPYWRRRFLTSATLVAYVAIEVYRYRRLKRQAEALAQRHTPLSNAFDRARWTAFFTEALEREGQLSTHRLERFISSVFWSADVRSLTCDDIQAWLRMFLTTKEDTDRTAAEQQKVVCMAHTFRLRIEALLGWSFISEPRDRPAPFIRINHPSLQNTPATPLLLPIPCEGLRKLIRFSASAALTLLGFERTLDAESGILFWIRSRGEHASEALLFLPGFGLGAVPYVPFIFRLLSSRIAAKYSTLVIL